MSYKITRFEEVDDRIFVNIEVNDDLGMYNYGRWMAREEADLIKKEYATSKKTREKYMQEKSILKTWAENRLEDARTHKLADIEASKNREEDDKIIELPQR